jgi:cation:H+ antiporter
MTTYLLLAGGLTLLVVGGELLVRGASTTAARLGMSPLLIGLTLVGFGTSAPELVTSVEASLMGSPGIALGNIVGSNISNILLILGISALIAPMAVNKQALRRDGSFVLATAVLFVVIGHLLPLDRIIGVLLLSLLVLYLFHAYRQEAAGAASGHTAAFEKFEAHDELLDGHARDVPATVGSRDLSSILIPFGIALTGLVVVILGGRLLVTGAIDMARQLHISESLIGVTIVSIGTSLPELVTSVIAALRSHSDVALGNILGSNIYNILGIGGATAAIAPTVIPPEILRFDATVMVGASIALLLVARSGMRIGRWEGGALCAGYGLYLFVIWPLGTV